MTDALVLLGPHDAPVGPPLICTPTALFVDDWELYNDVDENGDPDPNALVDLTGYAGLWIVRTRRSMTAAELTRATTDDGRLTFPDPTAGQVHLELPADDTNELPQGCYWSWLYLWPAGSPDQADCWHQSEFEVLAGGIGALP